MAVGAIQPNSINLPRIFSDAFKGADFSWIRTCFPFLPKSKLSSLEHLERRLTRVPENANRVSKVFYNVAKVVGWGALISQFALSNTSIVDMEEYSSVNTGLNYGLIGFPLSSMIGVKRSFANLSFATKVKDKESIDYHISNVVMKVFATLAGIFYVLAKFAVDAAVTYGTSILMLPFYGISYLIDLGQTSNQIQICRNFKKELNQIIKNENDLNDTKKLKKSIEFLFEKIQITEKEEKLINSEADLNRELASNPDLRKEWVKEKIEDLVLSKYIKLERKIGKKAAESFRKNVKEALNGLKQFFPNKDQARELIKTVQNGLFIKIRNNILMLICKIVIVIGVTIATISSGGGLAPIFKIL